MNAYEKKRAEVKRQAADRKAAVGTARTAVDSLLKRALRDEGFTLDERQQISFAMRALDSVAGGFCNNHRRR